MSVGEAALAKITPVTTSRRLHLDTRAVILVIGCCAVWAMGQAMSKVALAQIPPVTQCGLRSLGGGLLVLLWTRWRGIRVWERDGTLWPGLLAGALFAAEFACVYLALGYTTVGRTTTFLYLAPFVVVAGMPFIARSERLGRLGIAGLVLAFTGTVVAFSDGWGAASGTTQWMGDLLAVAAAIGWGATTLVIRATSLSGAHPAKTLLYQLGVSGVGLTVLGLAIERPVDWPLTPLVTTSLIFQTVVVSSTSYLVWFWLIREYAAPRLSAFTLLTPIIALAIGTFWLREPWSVRLILALVAVGLGLLAVNYRPAARS